MENVEVIQKIKKILQLTKKSSNSSVGEVSNAMALSHKLLKKHHLSMSEVMAMEDENKKEDFYELKEEEAITYKTNTIPKWMINIILSVNILTLTKTLVQRVPRINKTCDSLSILFIGDAIDVDTGVKLFNFLRVSVQRLASNHKKEIDGNFTNWRSFAEGCALTLLKRSKELNNDLEDEINELLNINRGINKYDISNFDLEGEEYEILDDKEDSSLVLYNNYQSTKVNKILDYINNKNINTEKIPKYMSKTIKYSYQKGINSGYKIPLEVHEKLTTEGDK